MSTPNSQAPNAVKFDKREMGGDEQQIQYLPGQAA